MISIDVTLFFQVVNFLVTLFILNVLIIRPIREVLARRRARNAALAEDADSMKSIAARKLEGYEARILQARAQMASFRDEARKSGESSARTQLESAGETARSIRQEATERTHKESAAAREELEGRVAAYAESAIGKVLGL